MRIKIKCLLELNESELEWVVFPLIYLLYHSIEIDCYKLLECHKLMIVLIIIIIYYNNCDYYCSRNSNNNDDDDDDQHHHSHHWQSTIVAMRSKSYCWWWFAWDTVNCCQPATASLTFPTRLTCGWRSTTTAGAEEDRWRDSNQCHARSTAIGRLK